MFPVAVVIVVGVGDDMMCACGGGNSSFYLYVSSILFVGKRDMGCQDKDFDFGFVMIYGRDLILRESPYIHSVHIKKGKEMK